LGEFVDGRARRFKIDAALIWIRRGVGAFLLIVSDQRQIAEQVAHVGAAHRIGKALVPPRARTLRQDVLHGDVVGHFDEAPARQRSFYADQQKATELIALARAIEYVHQLALLARGEIERAVLAV